MLRLIEIIIIKKKKTHDAAMKSMKDLFGGKPTKNVIFYGKLTLDPRLR